jgi:hypothetical protein
MKLAAIYLKLMGAMSLFFGLLYVANPGPVIDAAGFGTVLPGGLTDVRATYGGFQIGMGAFLFWASTAEERVRSGLLLVLLSIGAVGASRSIGLMLDGDFNAFHLSGLVTETVLTILTLIVFVRLPEESLAPQSEA